MSDGLREVEQSLQLGIAEVAEAEREQHTQIRAIDEREMGTLPSQRGVPPSSWIYGDAGRRKGNRRNTDELKFNC
jgi:hypothetical protein